VIHRLTLDAFAATPETGAALAQLRDDRSMAKSRISLQTGSLSDATAYYASADATPQVVIVEEDGDDAAALLDHVDRLADVCVAGTKVVVIGGCNDIGLYRALIGRGISEYLLRPVTPRQVLDTLTGLFSDPAAQPRGRIVACWGVRGGAGASTLAQNIAWSLGRLLAETVIYIDLDISFGTSMLAFNLTAKQTVADALAHPERLDEVLMDRCMVEYDDTLQILAAPGDYRIRTEITLEGIERLLDLSSRLAAMVVLDLPHGWSDWTEFALSTADEVVMVATPDFASLRDTRSLVDLLTPRRGGAAAPKLVLNRVDSARKTQLLPRDFQETIAMAPVAAIPLESQLFGEAANTGQMIGELAKQHKVTAALRSLAVLLTGRPAPAKKAASLLECLKLKG
jgi:pilus assembly protein CpaE